MDSILADKKEREKLSPSPVNVPPTHSTSQSEAAHCRCWSPIGRSLPWMTVCVNEVFSHFGSAKFQWRGQSLQRTEGRKEQKGKEGKERCPIHPSIYPSTECSRRTLLTYGCMRDFELSLSLSLSGTFGLLLLSWFLSSCHNNITELFPSGRAQVVMDTPIRWKVKRRFKEVRLSVLLVFLMFVTSRVSAGKRRISSSQTVTLYRGPRSPGAALPHSQSAVPGLQWPQTGIFLLGTAGVPFLQGNIRAAANNGIREVFPCNATAARGDRDASSIVACRSFTLLPPVGVTLTILIQISK